MSAKILTDDTVTIFHNGTVVTADISADNWDELLSALRDDDYDLALALIDKPSIIRQMIEGSSLRLDGARVYYGTHALADGLAKRILDMAELGISIKPMERFVERLYQNPSYRAIAELYRFLEHNSLPITDDGCFMAYKRIRDNWNDVYSNKINNSIGKVVTMPRMGVNDDCTQTCSAGLHFASLEYLAHYSGERLVAIKIDPADVVSIPIDYNNSKGRCCKYTVMEELPMSLITTGKDYWDTPVAAYAPNLH